jgi:hypothetical protein
MPIIGIMASGISGNTFTNTPPVTTNLWGWYDGSDSTTMTVSSGNISQWNNKSPASGGPNLSQATGGQQPNLESNVQSGRSAVRFIRANNDNLKSTTQPTTGVSPFTIFFVINTTALASAGAGQGQYPISWGSSNAVGAGVDMSMLPTGDGDSGKISTGYAGGPTEHTFSTASYSGSWVIVTFTGSGTAITSSYNDLDNKSKTTTSVNVSNNSEFFFGYLTNPWYETGGYNGYIGDVLIHTSVLSAGNQTSQINWLKQKWGIS